MKKSIFDFNDYRFFLKVALESCEPARGARSRLSAHLGCQTAFISQVLSGKVDFSLEHAVRIGSFFGLSEPESHFLVLLIHHGRAGSKPLRDYYQSQIDSVREQRSRVEERIEVKSAMSVEDQAIYYSAWYYAAIHVALSIGELKTASALSRRLGLPLQTTQEALAYLVKTGLARKSGDRYEIGSRRIHLTRDSVFIRKHHGNWRMKTIAALDFASQQASAKSDLHYSGVFTLSESDFGKVREILLAAIERAEPVLRESKEETLGVVCLDWFRL